MLYEYLLTFEDEVELLWRRKMNFSSWLFLANRAIIVIMIVYLALNFAGTTVSTKAVSGLTIAQCALLDVSLPIRTPRC